METNNNNLQKAIEKLPKQKLDEDIWFAIEKDLDKYNSNISLSNAISNLPYEKLENDLWEGIERKVYHKRWLEFFNPLSHNPYKVAATVILVIGLSIVFNKVFTKKAIEKVIYSEEWIEEKPLYNFENVDAHIEIADNISDYCKRLPETCEQEVFTDLNKQLEQLQQEKQRLKETIEKTRNQSLAKYLNRLENKELEIEKKILNLFKEN